MDKAFDSLSWKFLIKALRFFNFENSLIKWIEIIYTNSCACNINNGYTIKYFNLGKGVRQGDPISLYLFILAIEVLSLNILQNQNISGIKCKDTVVKIFSIC